MWYYFMNLGLENLVDDSFLTRNSETLPILPRSTPSHKIHALSMDKRLFVIRWVKWQHLNILDYPWKVI